MKENLEYYATIIINKLEIGLNNNNITVYNNH